MFNRILLDHLKSWKEKSDRKPLILRGARQVGKTTLVNIFSTEYDQYIRLNLEKTEDLKIFDPSRTFEELVTAIFFLKNKTRKPPNTLIFIDEIAEHIIGQEFMAGEIFVSERLNFWTREQKNAKAEVDFILQIDGHLVPVEVKSGGSGKLRSLLLYMDLVQDDIAVRFWSGKSGKEELISKNGKPFILINLPLYVAGNLKEMIARGQFGRIKSQPD